MSKLRIWLRDAVGLKGNMLDIAFARLKDEGVQDVESLQELHSDGLLPEAFERQKMICL